jgi:hypothetical protein
MKIPEWLKKEQRELFDTAKKQIRAFIVIVILGIVATLWGHIENLLRATLTTPILQWNTGEITTFGMTFLLYTSFVVTATLVVIAIRSRKRTAQPKPEPRPTPNPIVYGFVTFRGLKWRYSTQGYAVEQLPYCEEHELRLYYVTDRYSCPTCGSDKFRNLSGVHISNLRNGAQSLLDGSRR